MRCVWTDLCVTVNGESLLLDKSGAAWWPRTRSLIFADLHFEKGSSYARGRQFLPPYDTRATLLRMAEVVARRAPVRIIALGDSFHDPFAAERLGVEERGMLDRTVVMVSSEFGRTPKINSSNGRDHYPRVFSVALAGGGFKKGMVYGSSDALAGEPDENPVGPESLAKTMYRLIGINAEKRLMAPGNRPIDIVNGGTVINEIIARRVVRCPVRL